MFFYEFPSNLTLDEVTAVVAEHNEKIGVEAFLRIDKGDYIVFNYFISFSETFPEIVDDDPVLARKQAILRECRGLTFSKQTGKVIARKYPKFFNCDQTEETQAHRIDWSRPRIVMRKLDGSMITPFRPDNSTELRWGTKMGLTDVALPVEEFVASRPHYNAFALACEARGMTAMFEWCSRKQRIVIDYPEDMLILTALRDIETGAFVEYPDMVLKATKFDIPVVEVIEASAENIEELKARTEALENEEGFVIRFHSGHMIKLKNSTYCLIHGTKDALQSEKDVMRMIFEEKIDDLVPFMTEEDRNRVDDFTAAMEKGIAAKADAIMIELGVSKRLSLWDRKNFAIFHAKNYTDFDKSLIFSLWDGGDPEGPIRKIIKSHLGSSTRIDQVRYLMGGVKWEDFRDKTILLDD